MRDTNKEYWDDYDGLQYAKHNILRRYLDAWFPILTSWSGRVLYIDCNAGVGRHRMGEEGSPIIALNCLLNHSACDRILANAEVNFLFFEKNEHNAEALRKEINALGRLPAGVRWTLECADYERQLSEALDLLQETGNKLAPAFAFVDPYGFKISMDLLNRLLSFSACELFINLMYRYVDMSIRNSTQAENIDNLFGTTEWRYLQSIEPPDERLSETVELFSSQLNARHITPPVKMYGAKNAVKYVLLFATNNRRGKEKMKEAIWKVIPDGSYTAHERDNPKEPMLPMMLRPKLDLRPLEDTIWSEYGGRRVRIGKDELDSLALDTRYLPKHVGEILRDYRNKGIVAASGYGNRFGFNKSPLFEFPDKRP
jgi:three-Cys-motif partner protein